ncbi:hypothetical protein JCQ34_03120 [Pseudarthrobacter defluvii]|nr:hypothetical protein JCQ34_03120 [Pseudarthrobacter defluvii]
MGRWHGLAFALSLLIPAGATAGCSYEYDEPTHTPQTESPRETRSPVPSIDPLVLEREVHNYRELDRLLKATPGPVLLFEEGPLDGPVRGFGTTAEVPVPGQYTFTAACVGASSARVAIGQEHPGAPFQPVELTLDCIEATTQVMELQQGYVFAHLVVPAPGDTPWTGAVGGVRVTGGAPTPSTGKSP